MKILIFKSYKKNIKIAFNKQEKPITYNQYQIEIIKTIIDNFEKKYPNVSNDLKTKQTFYTSIESMQQQYLTEFKNETATSLNTFVAHEKANNNSIRWMKMMFLDYENNLKITTENRSTTNF